MRKKKGETKKKKVDKVTRRKKIGEFIKKKKSIIPNTITMSNMTMGFFAILFASKGDIQSLTIAGVLVVLGSVFDAMDGAVARGLKVESQVGVELDSLADGIAYGIAPAVIAYQAYLVQLPSLGNGFDMGMVIAPIYPICAIYRLARFNISIETKSGFNGLPSPAAGIIISSIPALSNTTLPRIGIIDHFISLELFIFLYICIGLLMISRIDYNKIDYFKLFYNLYMRGPAVVVVTVLIAATLLFFLKMWAVFIVTAIYAIVGLIYYMMRQIRRLSELRK